MAEDGVPETTVRIALFAKAELKEFVDELSARPPVLPLSEADLVGALVLAARRSPVEGVRAVVATYWDRRAEVRGAEMPAVLAICLFIRAHGG